MITETVKTIQMHLERAEVTRKELSCLLNGISEDDFSNQERVKVFSVMERCFRHIVSYLDSRDLLKSSE